MAPREQQMECPIGNATVIDTYVACHDAGTGRGHALTTQVEQFLSASRESLERPYGRRAARKSAAARRCNGRTSVALMRVSHHRTRA